MAKTDKRGRHHLNLEQPEAFLARERAVQRVGLVLLAVFAVAGAAGVFGNGVLSQAVINQGATHISYERFTRQTVATDIAIAVNGLAGQKVEIGVSREFLWNLGELEVRPDTVEHRLEKDAVVFEVPITDGGARVELHYKPRDSGLFHADVAVNGAPAARFWQLIYF